jgi:hypothetical protein
VDGGGLSLQRLAVNLYGNEPLNWGAATPTPGGSNGTTSPDTDKDGIPGRGRRLMGLDYNDPLDAALDNDFDGLTNLQEYLAGTDHEDEDSSLKFTYSVLYKNSLTDGNWTKLTDLSTAATNELKTATDSLGTNPARLYRLVTPALP